MCHKGRCPKIIEAESDGSEGSHYIHQIMIILVTLWVERDLEEQSAKNGKQKHCVGVDPKRYWTKVEGSNLTILIKIL